MADKGYDSAENRKSLSDKKLKCRIMHKAQKNRPLTEREKAVNKAVSKVRYAVERTYGSMHRWFGAGIARYVGLAKTHARPRRTRNTSWRQSPTTYTARLGLLCPIASIKGKMRVRESLVQPYFPRSYAF